MTKDTSLLFRLRNAVEVLATGQGDVRSRLKDIYLYLQPIQNSDLPKTLQKDWSYLMNQFTKHTGEFYGESSLDTSLRKIKNSTGQKIAKIIYKVWQHIEKN